MQEIGCTRHKCSSKLGIFCTHLHYLYILEWYTPARWGATPAASPCATPLFLFFWVGCGIRPVPHSRQTERGHPPPPINGVDNAPPPPASSCMPGGSPVSMTVSYSVSACGADSWPCGRHSHTTAGAGDCRAAVSGYHPLLLSSRCALPLPSREDVQHEGERQNLVVAGAGMDMCQLSRLPWASQVRIHRRGTSPGMEDNRTPRQGFRALRSPP